MSGAVNPDFDLDRKKAYHHKTRSGCGTCKIRHVKPASPIHRCGGRQCDEAKPLCRRCTSTGRVCDGYVGLPPRTGKGYSGALPRPAKPSLESEANRHGTATKVGVASLSTRATWAPEEFRSLQFHEEQIASTLRNQGAVSPFWHLLVPQSIESFPAVKHMAVAVASLYESIDQAPCGGWAPLSRQTLSLEQCNLAITELVTSTRTTPKEILLITCIFLMWFEILRLRPAASYKYLQLGLGMLNQNIEDSLRIMIDATLMSFTTVPLKEDTLPLIYAKIGVTAQYAGWGLNQWQLSGAQEYLDLNYLDTLPKSFRNTYELWSMTGVLKMACQKITQNLSNMACISSTDPLAISLKEKLRLFVQEQNRMGGGTPYRPHDPQPRVLSVICSTLYISIRCQIVANDECLFDEYIPQFRDIIQSLKTVVEKTWAIDCIKDHSYITPFCVWSIDRLYFVASNCRDPIIRREAINLLVKYRRREVCLDSWTAGKLAERKMEIEERGLGHVESCSDIPPSHRIRIHDVAFDQATSKVVFRYMFAPFDDTRGPLYEQRISWPFTIRDLAVDQAQMTNQLLQAHKLFAKSPVWAAQSGTARPMTYRGRSVKVAVE